MNRRWPDLQMHRAALEFLVLFGNCWGNRHRIRIKWNDTMATKKETFKLLAQNHFPRIQIIYKASRTTSLECWKKRLHRNGMFRSFLTRLSRANLVRYHIETRASSSKTSLAFLNWGVFFLLKGLKLLPDRVSVLVHNLLSVHQYTSWTEKPTFWWYGSLSL